MRLLLLTFFLLAPPSFSCEEHPKTTKRKPLWLQELIKASSTKKQYLKQRSFQSKEKKTNHKTYIKEGPSAGS